MSIILRQSTQIKVRIGVAVAVADGFTPVTTLTLSGADEAELLKANGAATVDISGATFAAISGADGWYDLTLTASHTDTVGEVLVVVNDDSLILPIYQRFQVVEEAVYDALFAASAPGYVANQPVDLNTIKTQSVTCAAGVTVLASVGTAATSTAQTGDNFARLGAPAGASVSADVAAVLARTPAAASITNINTVFNTDFAANYDTTNDAWKTSVTHLAGSAIDQSGGLINANVKQISTDATAADNLETMLDGTGGQTLSLGRLVVSHNGATAAVAITNASAAGAGMSVNGGGQGAIFQATSSGYGLQLRGVGLLNAGLAVTAENGDAIYCRPDGGDHYGIACYGSGTESGFYAKGGATGVGCEFKGGDTSGDALKLITVDGDGITGTINGSGKVLINGAVVFSTLAVSGATTLTGAVTASNASNNIVGIDVAKISGDGTAADNAEAFFDGTGYAGTNNVIPTVTNVTNLHASAATAAALASLVTTVGVAGAGLTALASQTSVDDLPTNAELATALGTADDAVLAQVALVKAKTDNLPSVPADQSAVEAAITAATSGLATAATLATVAGYLDTEIAAILADTNELQTDWADGGRLDLILDARASQASVDDLPTNAELATSQAAADDATLAAIAALNNLSSAQVQTAATAALTAYDPPTNAEMEARTLVAANYATPTNITSASGVILAATGLDSISVTAPSGVASNFREMLVQLWRRFFKKSTLTATELKTYADNGSTVVTTQTVSDDGTTQTQGGAS